MKLIIHNCIEAGSDLRCVGRGWIERNNVPALAYPVVLHIQDECVPRLLHAENADPYRTLQVSRGISEGAGGIPHPEISENDPADRGALFRLRASGSRQNQHCREYRTDDSNFHLLLLVQVRFFLACYLDIGNRRRKWLT